MEYRRALMLLIFILVCSTTRMATASLPPNIIFHSEDRVSWFAPKNSAVSKDETVKYKDAAMSVKWELTQGTVGELRLQQLATRGMTTDWTQYDTLKLRLYCPQANGNHILIRPTLTQDGYSEKQEDGSTIPRYYEQSFDMDWTGWREIAIPLDTFVSNNMASWDSIQSIGLFETNKQGGVLYFDEIWLENHTDCIEITHPKILKENGNVFVSIVVTNLSAWKNKPLPVTVVGATYQSGRLTQICVQSEEIKPGMLEQIMSVTLETIPANAKIKAFVWNSLDQAKPYLTGRKIYLNPPEYIGAERVTADGSIRNIGSETYSLKNAGWVHLEGTGGYYFPSGGNLLARKTSKEPSFFELWFDHGVNPDNEAYAYTLLPGKSVEQTAAYAQSPDISVLCNTPQLQVVQENKLGITGMVFWQAGTWEDITVSQPMIVMVRQQGEKFEISASDPTQKLEEAVITIGRSLTLQSLDEKISVSGEGETILTIDTEGAMGRSFSGSFRQ